MPISTRNVALNRATVAPYSRKLQRGAIGDCVDGRSTLGRFIRDLECQLTEHCGGNPSVVQKMMIERVIKIRVQLDLLDEKIVAGNWTPHDQRTYGALLNAHRLACREIGMRAAPAPVESLEQILARGVAAA